jgi:hypothetical protein
MGGGPKKYGIWLSLADPGSMIMSSPPPTGHELLSPDVTVAVTGEQNYTDALHMIHGGATGTVRQAAELVGCSVAVIERGKKSGRIKSRSHRYRDHYRPSLGRASVQEFAGRRTGLARPPDGRDHARVF